jgi:hypothetical protein
MPGVLMLTGIKDRNVIPRWRDFDTTVLLGELQNPTSKPASPPQAENIELVLRRAREWQRSCCEGEDGNGLERRSVLAFWLQG